MIYKFSNFINAKYGYLDDIDMTQTFKDIINHNYVKNKFKTTDPFRILLHNGDNDLACDHIQAEYFAEELKTNMSATVSEKG